MGSRIGPDEPLAAAGLDSLGATDLRTAIAERFGAPMPATLAFDFPTVRALAPFVAQRAALLEQAAALSNQDQGHHLLVEPAEKATEVLHITLDVLADVLGSAVSPDTPLMEVMEPAFPGVSAHACMPRAQSALWLNNVAHAGRHGLPWCCATSCCPGSSLWPVHASCSRV